MINPSKEIMPKSEVGLAIYLSLRLRVHLNVVRVF
jgi:hypothetical protein